MSYAAHSPPGEFPELTPHSYADHIQEVLSYGLTRLDYLLNFSSLDDEEKRYLRESFIAAAVLHDLGKLDKGNQPVLQGGGGRLAVDHIDAGTAVAQKMGNELLAWLIRGHHAPGLPSRSTEKYFIKYLNKEVNLEGFKLPLLSLRGLRIQRSEEYLASRTGGADDCHQRHYRQICHTDNNLTFYLQRQLEICKKWPELQLKLPSNNLTTRLLLSCLVDGDHGSAAAYSSCEEPPKFIITERYWQRRFELLQKYIEKKVENSLTEERERNELRQTFFEDCCNEKLSDWKLIYCSAPVGLGKTTSVTAYLLRHAMVANASRLIVVAPFTNIINQTVKTFRNALVLEGENPEHIVAAHHHKIEFSDERMRQYNTLWRAPVVVTTAVQFFETLASADPVSLRKIGAIAGSVIFIDESHACVPPDFFRVTWHWLSLLAEKWGCRIVLSSGSMIEFWNDEYLVGKEQRVKLPDLLSDKLRIECQTAEKSRVVYKQFPHPFSKSRLTEILLSALIWEEYLSDEYPSCLVILNTVQSAAVVANALAQDLRDSDMSLTGRPVLHISTALAPVDRDLILSEIERRQCAGEWRHRRWYLVATSCVEAGVDLDFSIAFRERCSVTSLLQVAGRVNRHGRRSCGVVFDFTVFPEDGLSIHPGFKESSAILDELWPELVGSGVSLTAISTKAIKKEFSAQKKNLKVAKDLLKNELRNNFQEVQEAYSLIRTDTRTVITNEKIVAALQIGVPVSWQDIQNNSVQLWCRKIGQLGLEPIRNCKKDHIYSLVSKYDYDSEFLGIMGGLLKIENFFEQDYGVI
jgi:hypothetical protein